MTGETLLKVSCTSVIIPHNKQQQIVHIEVAMSQDGDSTPL